MSRVFLDTAHQITELAHQVVQMVITVMEWTNMTIKIWIKAQTKMFNPEPLSTRALKRQ